MCDLMKSKNLNYAYYKEYYDSIDFLSENKDANTEKLETLNEKLCGFTYSTTDSKFAPADKEKLDGINECGTFKLATCYPGLLIGTGQSHQFGGKGELALGFSFDYVTGMPYIPGSSVKGVLRSAFRGEKFAYGATLLKEGLEYNGDVKKLVHNIFGPEPKSHEDDDDGSRDIFFDAVICDCVSKDAKGDNDSFYILATDTITPHNQSKMGELADPNPISFLKIRPGIVFQFSFLVFDYKNEKGEILFSAENKIKLFRQILLDLGIGAKTNVGYGNLTELPTSGDANCTEGASENAAEDGICKVKGCTAKTGFNQKTGRYYPYCITHRNQIDNQTQKEQKANNNSRNKFGKGKR